jgi:hypothetical protein
MTGPEHVQPSAEPDAAVSTGSTPERLDGTGAAAHSPPGT